MVTLLRTKADKKWLRETHLKGLVTSREKYSVALLYGNEDCPEVIELFVSDRFDEQPMKTFQLVWDENEGGSYILVNQKESV